jgi:hypothetical protein
VTRPDRDGTAEAAPPLSEEEEHLYASLADLLIPEADGMPSASQAEVPSRWLHEALRFRPDLAVPLRRALDLARGQDPAGVLTLVNGGDPEAFEALGTLTAGAYFLNPETRRLVGYPGQVAVPIRDDVDDYIDMLARVVERGEIYRDVEGAEE